ncbi:MAG: putative metal-binding motif-containing protein [Sandaracinaceae bacterium]|nr:putative metal-binding motif-containing protein [Sandaracinaceae bacterium]
MTRWVLAPSLLACAGCSLLLGPAPTFRDAGGADGGATFHDGSLPADAGPPCASATDCAGNLPVCAASGRCLDCDADGDGFTAGDGACDAVRGEALVDCDDARADVHPGAPVVCGDGALNACAGVPEDVGRALSVEELGVLPSLTLYLTAPEVGLESPTVVALQSSGGELNSAVAARVREPDGRFAGWLLPFDHTSPAPLAAPVVAAATSREFWSVSSFRVWQRSPVAATVALTGDVIEPVGSIDVPYLGGFEVGRVSAEVSPVEPDRTACPFSAIVREAWSARGNWFAFVGVDAGRTVYSLHAVDATGSLGCVADVGAAGFPLSPQVGIVAAGNVVFGQNRGGVADAAFVWKPGGVFGPQPLQVPSLGDSSLLATSDGEYLLAADDSWGVATMRHLDCNRSEGCVELAARDVPTAPGGFRSLVRWGSAAALLTRVQGDDPTAHGIEVRFTSTAGAPLGDSFSVMPWTVDAMTASIEGMDAVTIPRAAGGGHADLLVAMTVRNTDDTMRVELARLRGCSAR